MKKAKRAYHKKAVKETKAVANWKAMAGEKEVNVPVKYQASVPKTYDITSLEKAAEMFAQSGMFKDATTKAQCFVKIMAGREWGINPFSAMQGINIIEGKPAMSGGLISSLIKKSGKYDYKILRHDKTGSKIEFFQGSQSLGVSSFVEADAQLVKTKQNGEYITLNQKFNWKSYPEAMYFNRALTKGARMYCPDVFDGAVYVPEELGSEINVQPINDHPNEKPVMKKVEGEVVPPVSDYDNEITEDGCMPIGPRKGTPFMDMMPDDLEWYQGKLPTKEAKAVIQRVLDKKVNIAASMIADKLNMDEETFKKASAELKEGKAWDNMSYVDRKNVINILRKRIKK